MIQLNVDFVYWSHQRERGNHEPTIGRERGRFGGGGCRANEHRRAIPRERLAD
jgi:hypothetical protein